MKYSDLTSPDLGRLAPRLIAVLPLAAIEQHGNHLPVVTDSAIAEELALRIDEDLRDQAAILPTLWCGSSHHHMGFPGTLSLRSETYVNVLIDLLDSLIGTGFRRIFLLNCHGGNQTPFAEALYRLNLKYRGRDEPWIAAASYWNLAAPELAAQTFMETPRLSHACEYETSLMMALRSDWINGPGRGEDGSIGSAYYDPLNYRASRVVVSRSFDQLSSNGALGSPDKATAEKGRQLFPLIANAIVNFLREFGSWPPHSPPKATP